MFIDLDKSDLVRLVSSCGPSYEDMSNFEKLDLGKYCGGFVERWEWNDSTLESFDESKLLDLYGYLRGKLYQFIVD